MKKLILVTVAIIGFLIYTTNVSAQTKPATQKSVAKTEQSSSTAGKYVDKNNNGVCDKHEANVEKNKANVNCKGPCKGNGHQYCKGKGNGNCNGMQKGNGNCNGMQKRDGSCNMQKK